MEAASNIVDPSAELEAAKAEAVTAAGKFELWKTVAYTMKLDIVANRAKIEELNSQLNEKVSELEKKTAEIEQIETASRGKKLA